MPRLSLKLVEEMDREITEGCVSLDDEGNAPSTEIDWNAFERQYPVLGHLRSGARKRLAAMGIYLFVVANRSGWGDAPGDEVGEAFERRGEDDWLDLPIMICNLMVSHEDDTITQPFLVCSLHTKAITKDAQTVQAVQTIMEDELGASAFFWNGTRKQAMLIKLDPSFDQHTIGFGGEEEGPGDINLSGEPLTDQLRSDLGWLNTSLPLTSEGDQLLHMGVLPTSMPAFLRGRVLRAAIRITQNSLCPPRVKCIWAGELVIEVRFSLWEAGSRGQCLWRSAPISVSNNDYKNHVHILEDAQAGWKLRVMLSGFDSPRDDRNPRSITLQWGIASR